MTAHGMNPPCLPTHPSCLQPPLPCTCACLQVKELGRGCFGSVWLAKWRGVEVALKEVLNPQATDTAAVDVFNEAEKLASLRHPSVMAFYGVVTNQGTCATVAEYICHGSLRSGLQKIKRKVRYSSFGSKHGTCCAAGPRVRSAIA